MIVIMFMMLMKKMQSDYCNVAVVHVQIDYASHHHCVDVCLGCSVQHEASLRVSLRPLP